MREDKLASGEFDIISRYFAPLSTKVGLGLLDDAAVLTPPKDKDLVFTKDALVADVHFFPNDPAALIAQKAMRVNLSDLAAMGAMPLGYLLALALPKSMKNRDQWLESFASGLAKDQTVFGWSLFGGDTVSTSGPLTITITAIGTVNHGAALKRDGAKIDDDIYVSGNLGDAALGLKCLTGDITPKNISLIDRYHLPQPRLRLGQKLFNIASAAMDISDGLLGDIGHICALSELGAEIEEKLIPRSLPAGKILESFPSYKHLVWSGGDDYELLFTAPRNMVDKIKTISGLIDCPITKIGRMTKKKDITIMSENGCDLINKEQGFRHF